MKKIIFNIKYFFQWLFGKVYKKETTKVIYPEFPVNKLSDKLYTLIESLIINQQKHLTIHPFLCQVAYSHSQWMALNKIKGHHHFEDRKNQILLQTPFKEISELVGYNFRSAEGYLHAFLNSPKHKKILDKDWDYIGIAVDWDDEGKEYLTIILTND